MTGKHSRNKGRRAELEDSRIWDRVDASGDCWDWIGGRQRDGYGRIWRSGKTFYAHRYIWELLVGPVPDGKELDHLCRVHYCVNPDHLEPVTHQVNILRSWAGIARQYATRTTCINGHAFTPDNTRKRGPNGRRCLTCHRDWMRNNG